MVTTLKIAGYCRISVDTERESDENTSIENQQKIIRTYVAEHFPDAELTIYDDRDRSGYTFEQRENYQTLRPKLLNGEYKILIVKDFSRFSRRNSYGLVELETLRDAGVRIIAISDGIDYPVHDDWMLIQFKFLMNEMPVTDTSKKVKTIIENRQKSGNWVCAVPYGYRIINTKEMTYEIDPPAAEVVREVFDLYNNGWGYKKIANYLTDHGVPTPRANEIASKEAAGRHTKQKAGNVWSIVTISGILKNDFYIGVLRQHKYQRKKINGEDQVIDKDDQIKIEHAHTPIIDDKTFFYTQDQLKRRSRTNYRGQRKYECPYSGMIFCGDCGAPMFSMSRPDLSPAYTCGTYHKRGLKGCTSHHIRMDILDSLLKRYVEIVMDNSSAIIQQLEEGIKNEPDREQQLGLTLESLQRQLEDTKEQYKALVKRRVIDTMGKTEQQIEIIEETYTELEQDLTQRIAGLEAQISQSVDSRNQLINLNRTAKTVMDVLQSILHKERLDKMDVSLIVDKIIVYEDRLDIHLKSDIDGLLKTGTLEDNSTFNSDSKDISIPPKLVQSTSNRPDKVFTVNVVNEGDPLEIYTNRDGEVIFKKYSLMEGVEDFASSTADTLSRTLGCICAVTDRDAVVAVAGGGKRELLERHLSPELEALLQARRPYDYQGGAPVPATDVSDKYLIQTACPIVVEGDVVGSVLLLGMEQQTTADQLSSRMAQAFSAFLGKHLEG